MRMTAALSPAALLMSGFLAPALLAAAVPPACAAEQPMSPAQFEAYATGKTLTYALDGKVYGAEQYLPGRQVVWAFKGDECRRGYYYAEAGKVCFVYGQPDDPQCWSFVQGDGGLAAHFDGDPEGAALAAVDESPDPLTCAGPDLGV